MIKKKHFKIRLKRKLLVLGTVLLGILLTYFIISDNDAVVELNFIEDVIDSANEMGNEYDMYVQDEQISHDINAMSIEDYLSLVTYYYSQNKYNEETKEEVYRIFSKYGYIYYYKIKENGEAGKLDGIMYNDPRKKCELNEEQLKLLFDEGKFSSEDFDGEYSCKPVGDSGYVFINWNTTAELDTSDNTGNAEEEKAKKVVLRIDKKTGVIEDSDVEDYIGRDINGIYDFSKLKDIDGEPQFITLNNGRLAYMYVDNQKEDAVICSYMYFSDIIYMYIRTCAVPLGLGWITLFFIMGYVLKFNKAHSAEEKAEIAYLHIYKDIYTDGRLVYHTIALGIFSISLVCLATIYIHSLINYSNNSTYVKAQIDEIEELYSFENNNKYVLRESYEEGKRILIESISDYYLDHPELLDDDKSLNEIMKNVPGITEITIFDSTGTIERDTSGHIGYTLSRDESSSEYALWDLIDGYSNLKSYVESDGVYYAGRRQDKDGIIRVKCDADLYERMSESVDMEKLLDTVNVNSDIKGYIDSDYPEYTFYTTKGADVISFESNQFSEEELNSAHSFVDLVGGKKYLIDDKVVDYYTVFFGKEIGKLYGASSLKMVFRIAMIFFIQQIMILLVGVRHKDDKPMKQISLRDSNMVSEDLNEKMMDENFRKLIRNMSIVTCLLIVLLLVLDLRYGSTPILQYLFGSRWEKGFNLFSVSMILIIGIGGSLLSYIIQRVIILFTISMGPRGLTIGRMTSSLVKFVFLIAILILMLYNLGVNPSTLLAGAGIAGAMISFCAQQTVNDMLSGFLIVFENLFNIGDWITVDDFRGQICEIGIRTTKLRIADTYKIYNNSELRKITIMEENGKGAICLVDVAYEEDINKVIDLIKSSEERYRKDIPAITFGPKVDGVLELGASGVTVRIWAHAEISKVNAVERDLRRVTKNIFDENGIVIPFNQVTIHNAE